MTLAEFIAAITSNFPDPFDEERAMRFVENADIQTLLSVLEMKGVKAKFVAAISDALKGKVSQDQIDAALARITAEVAKRHRLK